MSIDELSPEEIEAKQAELISKVPVLGGIAIGNKSLRDQLVGWEEGLYWAIRNRLIERGILESGRGKGGSVKLVAVVPPTPPSETISFFEGIQVSAQEPVAQVEYARESELYPPVSEVLRNQWAKEQGFDSYLVEITAKQGSKQTGGKWTRPDITAVGYKTFPYVPGRFLEVATFEVKPTLTIDVAAVYEAIAHRRASTRAFVIAHIPENKKSQYEPIIEALVDEAKKFGVGVIIAEEPHNFDTWDVLLEAERFEPDPARLNKFIAEQTSSELKEQIVRWFK